MALSPLNTDGTTGSSLSIPVLSAQPSRTYALNIDTGELGGFVDGADAIEQFAKKAIMTARYRFPTYDFAYGCELEDIIGRDVSAALLETEIPRVIREALIYDERILDVTGFEITRDSDKLFVSFLIVMDNETIPLEVTI